jgi:tetratricopeptide (TPR) repeat protein
VRHRALEDAQQQAFARDLKLINDAYGRKPFRIRLDNDLVDVEEVRSRIDLIARYQIGLAAAVSGSGRAALQLLESVIAESEQRWRHRDTAIVAAASLRLGRWVARLPEPGVHREALRSARADAEAVIAYASGIAPAYAILAAAQFLLGDYAAAEAANRRLRACLPKRDTSIYYLNRAVFAVHNRQFEDALRLYMRAIELGIDTRTSQQVVAWLSSASLHIDERYRLGTAILNDHTMDTQLALLDYEWCLGNLQLSRPVRKHIEERVSALGGTAVTGSGDAA